MNDNKIIQGLSIILETQHIEDLLAVDKGVAVVPINGRIQELLSKLTALAKDLPYYEALTNTPTQVEQNFRSCSRFEERSMWHRFAGLVEDELQKGFQEKNLERLLTCPLSFTDKAVQHYPQSKDGDKFGISPHRDQSGFVNLVVVLLLSGPSSFFICKDKQATDAVEIKAKPGDLILMRGGGFGGGLPRPHHFVGRIDDPNGRISFGLRQLTSDKAEAQKLREVFSLFRQT